MDIDLTVLACGRCGALLAGEEWVDRHDRHHKAVDLAALLALAGSVPVLAMLLIALERALTG